MSTCCICYETTETKELLFNLPCCKEGALCIDCIYKYKEGTDVIPCPICSQEGEAKSSVFHRALVEKCSEYSTLLNDHVDLLSNHSELIREQSNISGETHQEKLKIMEENHQEKLKIMDENYKERKEMLKKYGILQTKYLNLQTKYLKLLKNNNNVSYKEKAIEIISLILIVFVLFNYF